MSDFWLDREGSAGNWYVFWGEGRRTKRRSMGATNKELAKARQKVFIAKLLQPKNAQPDDILVESVLSQYQDDHGSETLSADTAERTVEHLKTYYAGKTVAYINKTTNKEYEKARRKFGWSNAAINRTRNTLRAALNHAVENGDLRAAPHVPTLPTLPAKERWLQRVEAAKLLRAARAKTVYEVRRDYLVLFILIGLYTGARHEAILSLTWDRVDLQTGRIDFRRPSQAETKKRRPNAPVSPRLLTFLRYARKKSNGTHVIEHRGGPVLSVKKAFKEACTRAKLKDVTPHTLKHTFITWLLREKVPVWQVAGLTATSVATITRVYGHHVQDDLAEALMAVHRRSTHKAPISPNKG